MKSCLATPRLPLQKTQSKFSLHKGRPPRLPTSTPVSAFQIFTSSFVQLTTRFPSGEKKADLTPSQRPASLHTCPPTVSSQATSNAKSAANAHKQNAPARHIDRTPQRTKAAHQFIGLGVPDLRGPLTRADDARPVPRDGDRRRPCEMPRVHLPPTLRGQRVGKDRAPRPCARSTHPLLILLPTRPGGNPEADGWFL